VRIPLCVRREPPKVDEAKQGEDEHYNADKSSGGE